MSEPREGTILSVIDAFAAGTSESTLMRARTSSPRLVSCVAVADSAAGHRRWSLPAVTALGVVFLAMAVFVVLLYARAVRGIDPETGRPKRFAYAPQLVVVDGGAPQVAAAARGPRRRPPRDRAIIPAHRDHRRELDGAGADRGR